MDQDLVSWEQRLTEHFRELASRRSEAEAGVPVFALEHGLEATEVEEISKAVRAHISHAAPSRDHALAWIVYAAEIGYGYAGDEYWQTFEEETPGWTVHGDRYWIRACYQMFKRKYGGAQPSGTWAEHFSIICWPITHAILPRDLQRQLAAVLYELRHSLSAELFESPSKLGELVATRSWNGTSRFQNFTQDTRIVGQIAAALLLQGELGTRSLIHPATLQRISTDLDRERRAREWLRGARRFAQKRAKVRGLALVRGATSAPVNRPEEARAEVVALGLEPRLVLRPKSSSGLCWEVSLEIPDLSHLLFRFPNTRDALTGSRCVVAGSSGRPLARGRCLHGSQRVTLSRWPRQDEVLLQFEKTDPQLDYLLRTECLLRPGPRWLFRIASDGLAYESRSLRVRPGERYIIVATGGPMSVGDHALPIDLECEGVNAALVDLPTALSSEWEEALRRLGLSQARTVEVWPAGLGAAVWDGEGHGEWLASECPCLGIRTDYPIDALLISMGTEPELSLELSSVTPGEAIFVQLPQLSVGVHTVRVCTRSTPSVETESLGDLDVVIRLREPRSWSPGLSPVGPLLVQVDPASPTLEQLWEGRVEVAVRGPAGRHIKCTILLRDAQSGAATLTKHLPPLPLPVTADVWRRHFQRHFQESRDAQLAYDTARVCEFEFTCDELGEFTMRCEREFVPLRWSVRRSGQRGYIVHLIDDSGDEIPARVTRFSFETPCVGQDLDTASQYEVSANGGLYVARGVDSQVGVILPPSVQKLQDLGCSPQIDRKDSTDGLLQIFDQARLWSQARSAGDLLSRLRKQVVLRAFSASIFERIGGQNWSLLEHRFATGEVGISELKRGVAKTRIDASALPFLAPDPDDFAIEDLTARVQHLKVFADRYHLLPKDLQAALTYSRAGMLPAGHIENVDPNWICEFALRTASDIGSLSLWAGTATREGIESLMQARTLSRAARFLVLMVDSRLRSRSSEAAEEIYAGWRWK